jgi:UDP-N-acetylmuramoyl-L-alanyl-D-glutamate--2,6-diaminopimelate ligase
MASGPTLRELLRRSRISGELRLGTAATAAGPIVTAVCEDSREVAPGMLFCCLVGGTDDGHRFAAAAADAGAVALCVEHPVPVELPQVVVPDTRAAVGPLALAAAGSPQDHMDIVGVTGTNGKTTVTRLLSAVLRAGERCPMAVGTLDGPLTTPRATELARRLAEGRGGGARTAILEVSSHGLAQKRVEGLRFAAAAFTNLSSDHLDYHTDMDDYYRTKRTLFEQDRTAVGIVCTDDVWGRRLAGEIAGEVRRCSRHDAVITEVSARHSRFRWRDLEVSLPLGGSHNVANAVVAATVAETLGVAMADIRAGLERPHDLPGRFEVVASEPVTVIVDFAHSPAALEQLLCAGRSLVPAHARLTVVFGCGGDRDAGKREAMGSVASRLADRVIITSDNPRGEDPAMIAQAILAGTTPAAEVELDRRTAIGTALATPGGGDIVIVAGKGHETSQIIGEQRRPFDDRAAVREILAAAGTSGGSQR